MSTREHRPRPTSGAVKRLATIVAVGVLVATAVGTGPFQFVSWQRDGDLVVERNPDYWQEDQPYLDRITFRPIPDEATRAASLSSGDVDAVQSARLSGFLSDVAGIPGVEVVLGLGNGGGGVLFNTDEPPLDDLRIRQSLAHAVDQQSLMEVAADDAAELSEPRTQFYPSDSPFYSEAVADAWLGHDPERAQELYDEYVNDPERSDGKPVGEPVALTLDTTNVPSLVYGGVARKP
jgi:peptide/nickel transport system substrate-binding protein